MPKLLLKFNAAVIKEIPLNRVSLTIGRKSDNDIVIDNPAVSSNHCKIALEGGTTYVNEKRIKKCGIHHQDVIGVAKHSLVLIEDNPAPPETLAAASEETMILSKDKQTELLSTAIHANKDSASKTGHLRVLKGLVKDPEYELKGLSTYIGKSDRVQIPIKGAGLFSSAPDVVASIHRKSEGYVLIPVAIGYPILNGNKVTTPTMLQDGDLIDCGGTTFQFTLEAS